MKKEKVNLTYEEKMKKNFKSYRSLIALVEIVLILVLIFTALEVFVFNRPAYFKGEMNVETIYSVLESESVVTPKGLTSEYNNAGINKMNATVGIVATIFEVFVSVAALEALSKLFKNIEETGKPFSEENLKLLKMLKLLSFIAWVGIGLPTIGLVLLPVLYGMTYIFEYGYKLQIESDETI